jgi:tetratricopeptide (TPR) repeat protein
MKTFITRAAMAAVITAATATAVTSLDPAFAAQARGNARAAAKEPAGPQVRREVGIPLQDALKAITANDLDTALAKLAIADMVPMKTPFEEYSIAEYLGSVYIKKMDYANAAVVFNRQVASGGAPDEKKALMYETAMKLNYQVSMDYAKVILDATELQKIQPLDDVGYLVLIQSYYSTMDYANAATAAKGELAAKAAAGMKPGEDVLGLLLNAQIRTKDEMGARTTLDMMATVSKKPEVWEQVMDFALSQQGISDHQLLNLYRLAMLVGTMKDTDYAAMATIDLQNGLPQEAKTVLTKANKPGDLLTQANQLVAKDQDSLKDLAAEAAKQTNGEIDVKLGESYYTYGRFDEAAAAIQKGLEKGGLKDAADAQTTLGLVLWAAGKKAEAVAAFDKAAAIGGAGGQVAHTWSLYGKREAV